MSLLDSVDGAVMRYAYGLSLAHPARTLYYNLTLTGLSVAVAALIGAIELIGLPVGSSGRSPGGRRLAGIERRWSPGTPSTAGQSCTAER